MSKASRAAARAASMKRNKSYAPSESPRPKARPKGKRALVSGTPKRARGKSIRGSAAIGQILGKRGIGGGGNFRQKTRKPPLM